MIHCVVEEDPSVGGELGVERKTQQPSIGVIQNLILNVEERGGKADTVLDRVNDAAFLGNKEAAIHQRYDSYRFLKRDAWGYALEVKSRRKRRAALRLAGCRRVVEQGSLRL